MEILIAPIILFIVMMLCMIPFAKACNGLVLPKKLAKIEELRHKAKNLDKLDLHMQGIVIGQVAKTNWDIKDWQKRRRRDISKWATPEEWDKVKLIELPKGDNELKGWEDMSPKEHLGFLLYLKEKQQNG